MKSSILHRPHEKHAEEIPRELEVDCRSIDSGAAAGSPCGGEPPPEHIPLEERVLVDAERSAVSSRGAPHSLSPESCRRAPFLRAVSSRRVEERESHSAQAMHSKATVFFNGVGYCSISEAVCATLLELYVPGFKVVIGETFQIDVGGGRTVDFMINGVMCEYHGVRLVPDRRRYGDFRDREEYHRYARELHRLGRNKHRRRRHIEETKARLAQNYFERRRRVLDEHPEYSACELIVATSTDEFYERVVMRFNPQFCPTRVDFMESFYGFAAVISRQNSAAKKQRRRRQAA